MLLWLFALLGTWLLALFVFALILVVAFAAPVTWCVGYLAIDARIRDHAPDHPLLGDSWLFVHLGRQLRIVLHYIDQYDVDTNVLLAMGGLVLTIPGFYLAAWMLEPLLYFVDAVSVSF